MCSHKFFFLTFEIVHKMWRQYDEFEVDLNILNFDLVYSLKFNKSLSIVENHIRFHKKKLKPCENNQHVILCQLQRHSKNIHLNK